MHNMLVTVPNYNYNYLLTKHNFFNFPISASHGKNGWMDR